MILGTDDIRAGLDDGRIICDPSPQRIEGAHIDVTLGSHYWILDENQYPYLLNLADQDSNEMFKHLRGDGHLYLPERSFTLAHTEEFIGTAPDSGIVPVLHTRSTLARWGLTVHLSAGLGDVGYASRWTLEIINPHNIIVKIPVGARVGCIVFQQVSGAVAAYQPGTRYNVQREAWTPEAMLPRKGNW